MAFDARVGDTEPHRSVFEKGVLAADAMSVVIGLDAEEQLIDAGLERLAGGQHAAPVRAERDGGKIMRIGRQPFHLDLEPACAAAAHEIEGMRRQFAHGIFAPSLTQPPSLARSRSVIPVSLPSGMARRSTAI